jgi:hypothetical protein
VTRRAPLTFGDYRAMEVAARRKQLERRRARQGWIAVPGNKPQPTLDEVSALLGSPCYEVFKDADGFHWMRRLL